MSRLQNQTSEILKHLQEGGSITTMEAFQLYGCTRLSARIFDLRDRGYLIRVEKCKGKTKYGEPSHYARYIYEGRAFA